jgi:hypothetical protein
MWKAVQQEIPGNAKDYPETDVEMASDIRAC